MATYGLSTAGDPLMRPGPVLTERQLAESILRKGRSDNIAAIAAWTRASLVLVAAWCLLVYRQGAAKDFGSDERLDKKAVI